MIELIADTSANMKTSFSLRKCLFFFSNSCKTKPFIYLHICLFIYSFNLYFFSILSLAIQE